MSELPPECAIGFKEWAGVCEALASGAQTLILRKGGIAEEGGVFTPEHRAFWLYPTRLHESQQGLRVAPTATHLALAEPDVIPIRSLAVVDSIRLIDREEELDSLEPFHVWTSETVHKRFHYRRPGLWVLGVRVWNRAEPLDLLATPEQMGCKTWVPLGTALTTGGLTPALGEEAWRDRRDRLDRTIRSQAAGGRVESPSAPGVAPEAPPAAPPSPA